MLYSLFYGRATCWESKRIFCAEELGTELPRLTRLAGIVEASQRDNSDRGDAGFGDSKGADNDVSHAEAVNSKRHAATPLASAPPLPSGRSSSSRIAYDKARDAFLDLC